MILITGASRGIGRFLFEKYEEIGENLGGTSFHTVTSNGDIKKVDVSDYAQVERWIKSIPVKEMRDLTLITCAGVSFSSMTHKSDPAEWHKVIDVNLFGCYHAIRQVLPLMRDQLFGRIICFSSIVAEMGVSGTSAYAASKSALWGLVKALAAENASKNITANCINLGYASIGMGEGELSPEFREVMCSRIPAGRFCNQDEIFSAVQFLRQNAYVNGTSIDVNGALI